MTLRPIFQPCQKVPVFINDQSQSIAFKSDLSRTLREVSNMSRTKFIIHGYTTELPKAPFFPRYTNLDYLIVALIARAESNIFPAPDAVAATTYFTSHTLQNRKIGVVVIDKFAYNSFEDDPLKVRSKMTILRHELGHVVGFGHSKEWNLMNAKVLGFPGSLFQEKWPKTKVTSGKCRPF